MSATSRFGTWAALLALGLVVFFAQGQAQQGTDALPYSTSYLLTGDYAAAGVDVSSANAAGGFVTGTINMSGVPANADILAAFLYWESIYSDGSQIAGVKFRDIPLPAVRQSVNPLNTACWAGTNLTMGMFRADVLPFLPVQRDATLPVGQKTGKRLVNDADLKANGWPLTTVTLPQGSGNNVPTSAGASLVVVYRDPAQPLKKIVLYDGLYIQPQGGTMTQNLRGFYQSSASKSAKLTHIVGSAAKNHTDQLNFNGAPISGALFKSNSSLKSNSSQNDRGWFTQTFDVSTLMQPRTSAPSSGYGETATTNLRHGKSTPYDCKAWGAIVFSTAVKDVDHDGLPDGLEDAAGGLLAPSGETLPNLNAMGASSSHPDIFVEVNAMRTEGQTTYGSPTAPYSATEVQVTAPPHNHLPTPEVLKMVGDVYAGHGITPHFDVGDLAAYHALGGNYALDAADVYLVGSGARGGEAIQEKACVASADGKVKCEFPDYPGTVGWKFGFQSYRDARVGSSGEELTPEQEAHCRANPTDGIACGRRRFDRIRDGLFHYALYAHARARPKSTFPCRDSVSKNTAEYVSGTCDSPLETNPDFHVPKSISGSADLPGGNLLITLGLWGSAATPFVQASTTLHELGHNLDLSHGGRPVVWGNAVAGTANYAEPNCKPNYLSSMSYMFQVHGLYRTNDGIGHLDYSGNAQNTINEASLFDGALTLSATLPNYRPAWFVPAGSDLASIQGATAATRFCNGSKFNTNVPAPAMARVEATHADDIVDWNGNGGEPDAAGPQNVNFDGTPFNGEVGGADIISSELLGFDDWGRIRLNQIGVGRAIGRFKSFNGSSFEGSSFEGSSFEGSSFEGSSFEGSSFEGSSFEGSSFEGSSFEGSSFEGSSFEGSSFEGQEMDFTMAKALGSPAPHGLTACVIGSGSCTDPDATQNPPRTHRVRLDWTAPTFGSPVQYRAFRVTGNAVTATSSKVQVGVVSAPATTLVDIEELPNGGTFTYLVVADFDDGTSGSSPDFATITAINDPPVALAEGFTPPEDTPATGNVLDNDSDGDSNHAGLRAVLVSGPDATPVILNTDGSYTSSGLTLSSTGSFTYTPVPDFEGPVSFQYLVNDGTWSGDPSVAMSGDSAPVTVTITLISRHTTTTVSSSAPSSIDPDQVTRYMTIYGDTATFTAAVTPDPGQSLTPSGMVAFSVDGASPVSVGIGQAFAPSPVLPVGTHTITAKYCGGFTTKPCAPPAGDSFFYGSLATFRLEVQPRPATITADAKSKTYGDANPALTAVVTGAAAGGDAVNYTLATTALQLSNVGGYPITVTLGSNPNYSVTSTDSTLTINKATPTLAVAFSPSTVTYDGNGHAAVWNIGGVNNTTLDNPTDGLVTISYKKDGVGFAGTPTDAASYTASATFASTNPNYTDADTTSDANLTIGKANAGIVVTPYSVIYDGTAHTATGSASGVETPAPADLTSLLHLGGTTHTAAGDYATDAWTFDGNANYNATSGIVHDAIGQAAVTAKAGGGAATYDGFAKSPSACVVTGIYKSDLSCANNPLSVSPAATNSTIVPVVSGTGLENFNITLVNGSYTISPAPSTTAFGTAPTPTFGGGNFTVSASNNSGGTITYSKVSGPCTLVNASAGTFGSTGAGSCVVRADSAATANYLASWAQQTVTIASAPATLSVLWYTGGVGTTTSGGVADYQAQITTLANSASTTTPNRPWSVTFWSSGPVPTAPAGGWKVLVVASPVGGWSPYPDYSALNTALGNGSVNINPAVNRVFLTGQDADWHYTNHPGAILNGPEGFLLNGINWAGSGSGMGLVSMGQSGPDFGFSGFAALSTGTDDVVIPTSESGLPINTGLTSAGLSNWSTSVHGEYRFSGLDTSKWHGISTDGSGVDANFVTIVSAPFASGGLTPQTQPQTQLWNAYYNFEYDGARTSGDEMLDVVHSDWHDVWRFGILGDPNGTLASPTIRVDPNAGLGTITPSPTNILNPSSPPYIWTGATLGPSAGLFTSLNTTFVPNSYTLGYIAQRNLSGGRTVAAGVTNDTRTFTVTLTPTDPALTNMGTTVDFLGFQPQPGPVSVSGVGCTATDGQVQDTSSPGQPKIHWQVGGGLNATPLSNTPRTLTCTLTLANSSPATPALYTPALTISGGRVATSIQSVANFATLTTSLSADPPDPLGTVRYDVTPSGSGAIAQLTRHFTRTVHFDSVNSVILPPPTLVVAPTTVVAGGTFSVSGTGVPGANVSLFDGANPAGGGITVDANGNWSTGRNFIVGSHVLTATQSSGGQTSGASASVTVHVLPPTPNITGPNSVASATSPASVTLTGFGFWGGAQTPPTGATVTIFEGPTVLGTAVVSNTGQWSTSVSLAYGQHSLTASQTLNGETSALSSPAFVVTVGAPLVAPTLVVASPTTVVAGGTFSLSGTGAPGANVSLFDGANPAGGGITVAADGTWSTSSNFIVGSHVLTATQSSGGQTSGASASVTVHVLPPTPNITGPDSVVSATSPASVTLTGFGFWGAAQTPPTGATVTIFEGSTPIGTAVVGSNGQWSMSVSLGYGTHSLTAWQTLNGETSALSSPAFVVTVSAPLT